jgi:hypothetical protein
LLAAGAKLDEQAIMTELGVDADHVARVLFPQQVVTLNYIVSDPSLTPALTINVFYQHLEQGSSLLP